MQHLKMEAYSAWKLRHLHDMLTREGIDEIQFSPLHTSPPGSRRRARLAAAHARKSILLGFNQGRSHHIVDLADCSVLQPELVNAILAMRPHLKNWLAGPKAVGDVQMTALPDGIDVVFIGGNDLSLDVRQDMAAMANYLNLAQVSWRRQDRSPLEPVAHCRPIMLRHGDVSVAFPPGSFLQATESGENALIEFTRNAIGKADKVLDLFCGLGGFGLSLTSANRVEFADLDGPAIASLSQAVRQMPQYRTHQRDLMREPFTTEECKPFDAVIYDPPRGGAKAQTEQLAQSKVEQIVAVSCDPGSFVRDAKILLQNGYHLRALQPVDQFLWSTHLELIAHFTR